MSVETTVDRFSMMQTNSRVLQVYNQVRHIYFLFSVLELNFHKLFDNLLKLFLQNKWNQSFELNQMVDSDDVTFCLSDVML